MLNRAFEEFHVQEKRLKMKRVLYGKTPYITEAQVEQILSSLDFEHQYHIKCMSNEQKFKNMLTAEHVFKDEKEFVSTILCIYGSFIPGLYKKQGKVLQQTPSQILEPVPCAAIKTSFIRSKFSTKTLRYIVLYFPHRD